MNRHNKFLQLVKEIYRLALKNYLITAFFLIILFVGIVMLIRTFFIKPTYLYVKARLGQGLWWASQSRPNFWFLNGLRKGEVEKDLLGQRIAEILSMRYYLLGGPNQYDIYLTLRLKTTLNKRTKKYYFKRWPIAVGSPIELGFPLVQINGTITEMSDKPFNDKYLEKTVSLVGRGRYSKDYTYNYDSIKVGDRYFDGQDYIFEVLDKKLSKNLLLVTNNLNAQLYEREIETTQDVYLKAKIKVKKFNDLLIFAEDQIITLGKVINVTMPDLSLYDYTVTRIE